MRKYKELCYHKKKLKMKKLGRTKRSHEKSQERNIRQLTITEIETVLYVHSAVFRYAA